MQRSLWMPPEEAASRRLCSTGHSKRGCGDGVQGAETWSNGGR